MNYRRYYEALINSRKMLQEERKQDRINNRKYYEMHHIVPRFLGGGDAEDNLILLTFKEHFLAHLFLYKQCKKDSYKQYAAFGALTQMSYTSRSGSCIHEGERTILTAKQYETYKKSYWENYTPDQHPMYGKTHTDKAKKSISSYRIGQMPAKELSTGKRLGMVPVLHKKVLSGEWVHITHGIKKTDEQKEKYPSHKGSNNTNYSGQNEEEIVNFTKEFCSKYLIDTYFIKGLWIEFCKRNGYSYIINKRFNNTGLAGLIEQLKNDGVKLIYKIGQPSKEISNKIKNHELNINKITHDEYIKNVRIRNGKPSVRNKYYRRKDFSI